MTPEEIAEINRERLHEWAEDLTGFHATAMLLVAVGHDAHSGEVHICQPEDIPNEHVILLLDGILKRYRSGPVHVVYPGRSGQSAPR